jgi:hypothetical protein
MKNKVILICSFVLFALTFLGAFAQIELNQTQTINVDHTGFYPFSSSANAQFMELLPESANFNVNISGFEGSPFRMAPAADNREIGMLQRVKSNGDYAVMFKAAKNKNLAGLSFRKGKNPTTITVSVTQIEAGMGNCPSPVSCDVDCTSKFDKCCEADAMGNVKKVCNPTGVGNACGCIKR